MARKQLKRIVALMILFLASAAAFAADPHDLYVRTGAVAGIFSGNLANGNFTSNINAEAELWLYRTPKEAFVARVLLANQSSIGRTRYLGAGGGARYFLNVDGMSTEQQFGQDLVRVKPHSAFYLGWDVGIGQFLVLPLTTAISSYATTVDVGGVAGVRKGISENVSMDALLGYTYSTNVLSTTTVTASMIRFMLGVGFTF